LNFGFFRRTFAPSENPERLSCDCRNRSSWLESLFLSKFNWLIWLLIWSCLCLISAWCSCKSLSFCSSVLHSFSSVCCFSNKAWCARIASFSSSCRLCTVVWFVFMLFCSVLMRSAISLLRDLITTASFSALIKRFCIKLYCVSSASFWLLASLSCASTSVNCARSCDSSWVFWSLSTWVIVRLFCSELIVSAKLERSFSSWSFSRFSDLSRSSRMAICWFFAWTWLWRALSCSCNALTESLSLVSSSFSASTSRWSESTRVWILSLASWAVFSCALAPASSSCALYQW